MLLDDEEEARDAVSEVFARLMEGKIHLPKENPEGYLLVCLRNSCLDRNRHLSVKERMKRHLTTAQPSETPVEDELELISEIISYAGQHLTPQGWRVFQLRFDEGLSVSEIADQLSISEITVYKHLTKALQLLREQFNPIRR
jgi:RNA polymerase sigma-70 factor (ECF subfamily)